MSAPARSDDGIFPALTDFGLTRYATPQLLRILYVIGFVVTLVVGAGYLIGGLFTGGTFAVAALIGVPLVTLLSLLYLRVLVEIGAVFFRMSQDLGRLADAMAGPSGPGGLAPGPGGPAAPGPGPGGAGPGGADPGRPGDIGPGASPGGAPPGAAGGGGQWSPGQGQGAGGGISSAPGATPPETHPQEPPAWPEPSSGPVEDGPPPPR